LFGLNQLSKNQIATLFFALPFKASKLFLFCQGETLRPQRLAIIFLLNISDTSFNNGLQWIFTKIFSLIRKTFKNNLY